MKYSFHFALDTITQVQVRPADLTINIGPIRLFERKSDDSGIINTLRTRKWRAIGEGCGRLSENEEYNMFYQVQNYARFSSTYILRL